MLPFSPFRIAGGWPNEAATALVVRYACLGSSASSHTQWAARWDAAEQWASVQPDEPGPVGSAATRRLFQWAAEQAAGSEVRHGRLCVHEIPNTVKSRWVSANLNPSGKVVEDGLKPRFLQMCEALWTRRPCRKDTRVCRQRCSTTRSPATPQ